MNSWSHHCARGHNVDYRSYIEYKFDKVVRDGLKTVVLYNATSVNKSNCPESVKNEGDHKAMRYCKDGKYYWDYQAVKTALAD